MDRDYEYPTHKFPALILQIKFIVFEEINMDSLLSHTLLISIWHANFDMTSNFKHFIIQFHFHAFIFFLGSLPSRWCLEYMDKVRSLFIFLYLASALGFMVSWFLWVYAINPKKTKLFWQKKTY